MNKRNYLKILLALCLAACSEGHTIKEKLGFNNRGPYEYSVMSYAPLSVPPDFDLPLPSETSSQHNNLGGNEIGKEILYGHKNLASIQSSPLSSASDEYLLRKAGVNEGGMDIRAILIEEEPRPIERPKKTSLWEKLFQQRKNSKAKDAILDAEEDKAARTKKPKH